ncbi:PEP-CTERM/exosortase system-associated acyltransferase [Cellvibrio sp. OA-2007]|uniref:PEP-CTERM/exosortase system-associated acyltransferase n=1 Tax=Cellvibrio sp. OA-2007 TaxID=529823 RepID=UPI0007850BE1|nr:PEP-CTERM/exosortase system-associated acyltransferase [Cellvibrio sp. OA-2007]
MKSIHHASIENINQPAPKQNAAALASDEAENIAQHFSHYLKPQIAKSDPLKQEVYKLRYQVYCEELHFEETNATHIEQDEFDSRSIHCFIRHINTNALAGTLRVIATRNTDELLPMEKFCPQAITDENLRPRNFPAHQICEVSRLAVPLSFRKRQVDQFSGGATGAINETIFSTQELRFFPYIAVSLYLSAIALCHKSRIHHVFVMMEPRLARSLNFVGIHFTQIGAPVEYHGKRAAYYVDIRQLRKKMSIGYRKLLAMIEQELFS